VGVDIRGEVADNLLQRVVVLEHLLVVAAALLSRARLDQARHLDEHLLGLARGLLPHLLHILTQEHQVLLLLSELPFAPALGLLNRTPLVMASFYLGWGVGRCRLLKGEEGEVEVGEGMGEGA